MAKRGNRGNNRGEKVRSHVTPLADEREEESGKGLGQYEASIIKGEGQRARSEV